MCRIRDDGLQRDEEGALRHAGAEAAGDNVERFQPVGVAVPAEEEGEVPEGRDGEGEDGEAFVTAGSGRAGVSVGGGVWEEGVGVYRLMMAPESRPPTALPTTAGTRCMPASVLELRAVTLK